MEIPNKNNFQPHDAEEGKLETDRFFGAALAEYYLTIEAKDYSYKGEGYVLVSENEISFYDDKMTPIYKTQKEKVVFAQIKGMSLDDISIVFNDEAYVNAER